METAKIGISEHKIRIVGSSHIARQSIEDIKAALSSFKPDIIALELDRQRYDGLLSRKKGRISFYSIRQIGFKGFIFALIGSWASNKLGKIVKMKPGTEMVFATHQAKKRGLKIELIDQDIQITLSRLSKKISRKEKWNFVADTFKAIFVRKHREELALMSFDLHKVPSEYLVKQLLGRVRDRYPNTYAALVSERNVYMAHRLMQIAAQNPGKKILAVVGAGHVEGIEELLRAPDITYSFRIV